MLFMSLDFADSSILGHYQGGRYLPESASTLIVVSLTSTMIMQGCGAAVSYLSANARGAGQDELAGRRLVLAVTFGALTAVLISPLWAFAGSLVVAFSGSSIDAGVANLYGRWRLVGILGMSSQTCMSSWASGRGVTMPMLYTNMVVAGTNVVLNFILLDAMGFTGSPLATALSRWLGFWLYLVFTWKQLVQCRPADLRGCFTRRRCCEFLRVAIPMTLQGLLQEIYMQILALFAANLGPSEIATHNGMLACISLFSAGLFGCNTGTRSRIAAHVVAGNIVGVRRVQLQSLIVMVSISLAVAISFVVLQDGVGRLFSADPQVWRLAGQLSSAVGASYLILTFFFWSMATLNATGQSAWVAVAYVLGSYVVGLPLSYYLGFVLSPSAFRGWPFFQVEARDRGIGLLGVWLGLGAGYLVSMSCVVGRVLMMRNWQKYIDRAQRVAEVTRPAAAREVSSPCSPQGGPPAG